MGGHSRTVVDGYPKRPLGHLRETNLRESHKISSNQASDVNGTDPRLMPERNSAVLSSTASYGISGDFNLGLHTISNTVFQYNVGCSLRDRLKSQTQKAKVHE